MSIVLKNFIYGFLTFICLLILLFLILRTPNSDPVTMKLKYGDTKLHRVCYREGNCIHIRDEGKTNGEAIILIHGSNDSLHVWAPLITRLGQDYRILTLDLPGHGLSGPHNDHDYSASAMSEAVTALVQHAELENFTIGGNSMGGWVAWRYTLDHPEKINRLILIDALGAPRPDNIPAPKLNLGFQLLRNPITRPFIRYITPRSIVKKSLNQTIFNTSIITEELVDRYWELMRYPGNRKATAVRATLDYENHYADRLNEINKPTLILWGQEDPLTPVYGAEFFHGAIKHSKKIIYNQIGHMPMIETPDRVSTDITHFMQTHPAHTQDK